MKRLSGYWKVFLAIFLGLIGFSVASHYVQAGSITVVITGTALNDGKWKVGDAPVTWSASAFDSDNAAGTAEMLDADSYITWTSSDPTIVKIAATSGTGTDTSQAVLTPMSAGTVNIKAVYTKRFLDVNGDLQTTTTEVTKKVVVKFEVTNAPQAPYEDTDVVPDINTTSIGNVTFKSSNENVAKVESDAAGTAKVTLAGAGSTVITAVNDDGQKVTFKLVVNAKIKETDVPVTVEYGETHNLLTNVVNANELYYSSDNSDVAEVDNSGQILGIGAGKTKIRVWTLPEDDDWYSHTPNPARSVDVEVPFAIITNPTLNVGDVSQLKTNIKETYASQISWNSSDTSVVEIQQDGTITGKKNGTAKIYATVVNKAIFGTSAAQYAEITVRVIDTFALDKSAITVQAGSTAELKALVTDSSAAVTWESDDENVVKVQASAKDSVTATVTAIKKGTALITAIQIVDGVKKKATCLVEVTEPVQDITIYPSSVNIDKGEQYPLSVTFTPMLPDNTNIQWESSDTSIVKVTQDGQIKGINGGSAVVWVITEDGIKVASCDVYVRVPVTGITLSETKISESKNAGTHQLTAKIAPTGDYMTGVNTEVEWSVSPSDGSIIKVDNTGLITYVKPGNATVIAKTKDGGYMATCQVEVLQPVESVGIDYTDLTLKIDETFRISAEVLPVTASDKSVKWESSDTSVVTVDANGLLSAKKPGSATVLVKTSDGGFTGMCNVTVYQPVTSVTISSETMTLRKGATAWISATALPSTAANKNITFSSSDTGIATIDPSTGMIKAIEAGVCTIVATSDDSGVVARCTLTVLQAVTGIKLNVSRRILLKGDQFPLAVTVTPTDAENKNVVFTSSDPTVATVDGNGVVTGLKGGQTVVTATTEERGLTASCHVIVQEFVTSVALSSDFTGEYAQKGDKISFTAQVLPDTATNKKITWKSNNPKVISVNKKGIASVKHYGTATIFAYASDGSGKYAMKKITVEVPLKKITFKDRSISLVKGKKKTLKPIFKPANATFKDVTWESADAAVASVDENGMVTAVGSGKTLIKCKSSVYGVVGTCRVSVKEYVEEIKITGAGKKGQINLGYTKKLKATVKPDTATNKKVTWSSDNTSILQVDGNGTVRAVGIGTAVITARATDGSGVSASVGLTVIKPVANISISPDSVTLLEGRSANVVANVSPADATYSGVSWKTSDSSVATVDNNGGITAVSAGHCVISATSRDGNKVKGVTNVTVKPFIKVTSIAISSTSLTMLPGQKRKVSVRVKPLNTSESISWYTSDASVATVDGNGNITACGQGAATIYAVSSESGMESSCEVVVLALNATYITLEQYDSYDLTVFGATETVSWYSNNKRVATVDSNGKVVARMAGKTTIAAKVNGKVLYCTVVVRSM